MAFPGAAVLPNKEGGAPSCLKTKVAIKIMDKSKIV
jgi:hypothetical protein